MTPDDPTRYKIRFISALLLLACLFTTSQADTLGISLSSTAINSSPVVYSFTLQHYSSGVLTAVDIKAGASISIVFPADYNTILPSSPICQTDTGTVLSCSLSGNTITISSYPTTGTFDDTFRFRITNIKNPGHSGSTQALQARLTNSGSTAVDASLAVTLTETLAQSCSLSTTSKIIGGPTDITFIVIAQSPIPAGGGLEISFPWWSRTGESMITSTTTCTVTPQPSPGTVGCSTRANPSGVGNQIIVTNLPAVATGAQLTFTFSSIRNPPVGSGVAVTLRTLDTSSLGVDSCSMTLTANIPNTLVVDSSWIRCNVNSNTKVVNLEEVCTIYFTITNPLSSGASIKIGFPKVVGLTSGLSVIEIVPNTGANPQPGTPTYLTDFTEVTVTGAVTDYYPTGTQFGLRFTSIKHPSTTKPTPSFQITTLVGGNPIDTITSGATYSASTGGFTSLSITASPSTAAGSTSSVVVSFQVVDQVTSASQIKIVFPSEFSTGGTVSCTGSGSASKIQTSPDCTNMTGLTLTVKSYAKDTITNTDPVTITISNMVLPKNTKPTATAFEITTLQDDYPVDKNIATYFSSTAGEITAGKSVTLLPVGSLVAGISTYTIAFQNKNPILAGGKFQIGLPAQVTITEANKLQAQVGTQINIASAGAQSPSSQATVSTISSILTVSFTGSSSNIPAGTLIQVIIPSITNPSSTALTDSFRVKTLTSDDYAIDETITGLNLPADTILPSDFQTVTVSASPNTTGRQSSYTFTVVPKVAHTSAHTLSITFPPALTLLSSASCLVSKPVAMSSFSCPPSGSSIQISMGQAVGALSTFELIVSGVTNPRFSTNYTDFTMSTMIGSAKVHVAANPPWIVINPSVITSATLERDNIVPDQAAVYTFNFTPINSYPNDAYFEVIVPIQLEVSTLTSLRCIQVFGIGSDLTCSAVSRTITITRNDVTSAYDTNRISFALNSIKNQVGQVDSDTFIIRVRQKTTAYIIDQITSGLKSLSPCNPTCLTCSTSNRDLCTSCAIGKLFDTVNQKCVDSCPDRTYTSGTQCLSCNSNANSQCLKCTAQNLCSSCDPTSSFPVLYSQQCLGQCPQKYYSVSNVCTRCPSPCDDCSSSTVCKSCLSGTNTWFWSGIGACRDYCDGGYYKNNDSLTCTQCKSTCLTCSSASVCTSCNSSSAYNILYNNDCYSTCPAGSYSSDSTCKPCTSPCLTCSLQADNCLSCIPGLFLSNGLCVNCASTCATCSGTADSCSSCKDGLFLQGNRCISGCSEGYYLDTGLSQCTQCVTGCLTCTSKSICTMCDPTSSTPYMYEGTCVSTCPSSASGVSNRVCTVTTVVERINPYDGLYREGLPFPFIIFALIFGVLSFVGKVITHQTLVTSNVLGFVAIIEFSAWVALAILLILSHPDDSIADYTGFPFVLIGIIASVIINIVFYFRIIRPIVKSEDFVAWKNKRRLNRAFAIISQVFAIISFKSFRLIYSQFFNVEPMSAPLSTQADYLPRFHKYLGLNFFLGVLPAFIASVITIHKDSAFSQLLNISIEIIILSLFSVALTIYEALRANEEAKKAAVGPDQTNLMIDDSVINKLASPVAAEGKKYQERKEFQEGREYQEADTMGLNQSSSFINLNNSMTMEKRVDGKDDESFDATEALPPGKGEENSKIEAIEEIEKDDEDDEPALNMHTKTMNKLQEMMSARGQELEPQKILIENKDGSIIVLKDPSPRKGRKKADGSPGKDEDSEQELELHDSFEKIEPAPEKKVGAETKQPTDKILDELNGSKELKGSKDGLLRKEGDSLNSGLTKDGALLSPIGMNPQTPGGMSEGFSNSPEMRVNGEINKGIEEMNGGKGNKKGEDGFEYASSESQVSADDLHNHFMEDTPSNYNVLNQRYDEEFVTPAVVVPKKLVPELDTLKDSMSGSPPKPIIMQHNFMEKAPQHMDYRNITRDLTREYPPPRSNSSSEKQAPQSKTGYGKPMLGEKSKIMAENGMRLVTPQYTGELKRVPASVKSGTPIGAGYKASGSLDRKKGDSGARGSRTGRLSDKGDKASTDRISELETMYIKKKDVGSVKSSLSKISKKQVNPQRSGDEDLSDNGELELDDFGKFEEFVNGMRRPSVQKFDADSFDREVS